MHWSGRTGVIFYCAAALSLAIMAGCRRQGLATASPKPAPPPGRVRPATDPATVPALAPATMAATLPATAPATLGFTGAKGDFSLTYPRAWVSHKNPDYVLQLLPASKAPPPRAGSPATTIQFDVPELPPHLPGMIRMHLIQNGYVDDLRKSHPGLKVEETVDRAVPGAQARLVRCTWEANGKAYTDVALMMIRAGRVYILSADARTDALPETRATFDEIASSLHWLK